MQLASHHHLPKQFQNGHYDPHGMKRHYVLVHDNVLGPQDFLEEQARHQLKQHFPHNPTTVLRLNSLDQEASASNDTPDLWKESVAESKFENGEDLMLAGKSTPATTTTTTAPTSPTSPTSTLTITRRRGRYLSGDDILSLQNFVTDLTLTLIPAMERRIFSLNQNVTERKKGVKNIIKSFWRKPKDDETKHHVSSSNYPGR